LLGGDKGEGGGDGFGTMSKGNVADYVEPVCEGVFVSMEGSWTARMEQGQHKYQLGGVCNITYATGEGGVGMKERKN